jgi:hypothetical protein
MLYILHRPQGWTLKGLDRLPKPFPGFTEVGSESAMEGYGTLAIPFLVSDVMRPYFYFSVPVPTLKAPSPVTPTRYAGPGHREGGGGGGGPPKLGRLVVRDASGGAVITWHSFCNSGRPPQKDAVLIPIPQI